MLVKMAMSSGLPRDADKYTGSQDVILNQLPTSLYSALNKIDIDSKTTTFATCPSCNFTHEPIYDRTSTTAKYPRQCRNRIIGSGGPSVCGTDLLQTRNGQLRPIKPYVVASFSEYLARSLADPEVERLCNEACDNVKATLKDPEIMTNAFDAKFMRSFEGPVRGQLFIDRGDKIRLAFAIHVDFFNPNGNKKRGNHNSIGVISLANLNLPQSIRYLPEHIFPAGIIPGPHEPILEELNHFTRPVIDKLEIAWKRGIHISRTASRPEGAVVEAAIALSINDLPAARKVSGCAGHGSHFYCTVCSGKARDTLYNTELKWKTRDITEMRRQAEAWRDAETLGDRKKIFKDHGVRWSEFWRLPYWDPTQMLVIDSMHCILEGIVHYHCRSVLRFDLQLAVAPNPLQPAFSYPWVQYNSDVPEEYRMKRDSEIQHIHDIHKILTLPLKIDADLTDDRYIDESRLKTKLHSKNLQPLKFVCNSLNLLTAVRKPIKKDDFSQLLIAWVSLEYKQLDFADM
jgi:hypothetical protein